MFTTEGLKKLPFNYRSMKGREISKEDTAKKMKTVQSFNFLAIEKLHTTHHMIVNFYKPISKLFNPQNDDSNR
jgi:hypothetical protein